MNRLPVSIASLVVVFVFSICLVFLGVQPLRAGDQGPVAMLMKPQGKVELSKDGKRWRRLTRNKFLFVGYEIRTAAGGSAMLMSQADGATQTLSGATHIRMGSDGPEVVTGALSKPEKSHGALLASLSKRFKNGQLHSVVRRSKGDGKLRLRTARKLTLSARYPDLVWNNLGPEYSYQVMVGDKSWKVAPGQDKLVRFTLKGIEPGKHPYVVTVSKAGKEVYAPKKKGTLHWMDQAANASLTAELAKLEEMAPGDAMMQGALLDQFGLRVAAMDLYRHHFKRYPEDNDMRPLLIEAYFSLKLTKLHQEEAFLYNKQSFEELSFD
ncbi:MAG: hypothetical protein HQL53_07915 [Magnetococcales bacterium]|nr:hypothetical protein [Magnetococcales bacterium]